MQLMRNFFHAYKHPRRGLSLTPEVKLGDMTREVYVEYIRIPKM